MEFLLSVFHHIGNYIPFFLIFVTFLLLWNKPKLSIFYFVGLILNSIINISLKGFFQQARPSDDAKLLKIALKNGQQTIFKNGIPYNIFGMPSGHAQCVFYTTFFILFALKNKYIFIAYFLFSLLTCFQRVYYNYHTVFQVFVGAIIGSMFAYFIYYMARQKIMGKLLPRKEDNGPKYN